MSIAATLAGSSLKCAYAVAAALALSGCASVGLAPIPYSQMQDGAQQPFGFLLGTMPDDRTYIEFQGSPGVNRYEDMEVFVLNKAREVCAKGVREIKFSRREWYISVNGLGRPALGMLPSTGRVESFPKVSADVLCN